LSYLNAQVLSERSDEVSRERQGRVEKPPAEAIVDFIRESLRAANRLKRRRSEYLPPLVPDCGWDRGEKTNVERKEDDSLLEI
jgi:hypothetical protein